MSRDRRRHVLVADEAATIRRMLAVPVAWHKRRATRWP
jgi:hypothetical protein